MVTKKNIAYFLMTVLLVTFQPFLASNDFQQPITYSINNLHELNARSLHEGIIQVTSGNAKRNVGEDALITQAIARGLSEKLTWWDEDAAQSLSKSIGVTIGRTEDTSVQYFDNLNLARHLLYEELKEEIVSDSISFWDFEIDSNDKIATVATTVQYDYQVFSHTFKEYDDRSETKRYTYQFMKSNDTWELTAQITDDPWIIESAGNLEIVDPQIIVDYSLMVSNVEIYDDEIQDKTVTDVVPFGPPPNMTITYSVTKAVNYAVANYNNRSGVPFWYSTTSTNCQNFVSQAIFMGLNGNVNYKTYAPAVSTQRLGGDNYPNIWSPQQVSKYYSYYYYNWSWDAVQGFANLIATNTTVREGPYGSISYGNAISSAAVGNVLHSRKNGSATISTVDHAMFITGVTGTAGSRSMSNIKIAAHTNHTNSAYQLLSEYAATYQPSNFLRITVSGGRYVSPSNYN